MTGILYRLWSEWRFPAALLLAALLLATASPLSPETPGRDEPLRWEEYSRVINLEEAPEPAAFLFRVLVIAALTLVISGLVMDLQGLARGGIRVFPPGEPPRVPWGVGPVVKLAVYFLALYLLLVRLPGWILALLAADPLARPSWFLLGNAFLQFLLLFGLTLVFLKRFGARPISGERNIRDWVRRARQALRGYICFSPLLVLLIILAWAAARLLDLPGHAHPLVQPLIEEGRISLLWPLAVVGVVLAPLAEELFFRGLLFPALAKRIGVWGSAAVTAALFSTLHFNWIAWIPIFGLGVLLARAYHRTGSLLVPILIHAFHNALILAFAILFYQVT